jgi:hypothetical protein
MTETEWLACTDIYAMLEYLRGSTSDRKLRLFAVACCRRPYFQVPDERHRKALELAERMADEEVDDEERQATHAAALELWEGAWAASLAAQQKAPRGTPEVEALVNADEATGAGWVVLEDAWDAAYQVTGKDWDKDHADEPDHQLILLRDIFGNPFRPLQIDPAWLRWHDGAIVHMAQSIYDGRRFQDLPMLADALEEAGCTDPEILGHCRGPGEHMRGCWVVDLVLDKR